ncbi:MAG: 50S ribosome-binding GTPase [Phycisphaerae bacterium]|nr:50S ribosome-binding GTPase [Phycisphaerae bacterium]
MNLRAWLATARPSGAGAIACIELEAPDGGALERVLVGLGCGGVRPGGVAVRTIAGVDRGVVARWDACGASLMPHGGPEIVRRLLGALRSAGAEIGRAIAHEPRTESAMDDALAAALGRAASARAVDVLLVQPARWAAWRAAGGAGDDRRVLALSAMLNRLVDPPLVVVLGPSNVGKSTLLNALAGRTVAVTADAPGTTRDHVGVTLELDGLTVRWADTPGFGHAGDAALEAARAAVWPLAARAALVVLAGDAVAEPPAAAEVEGVPAVRVALRDDLGGAAWPADVRVSVRAGRGVEDLARAVRTALVPDAALSDQAPWRFWEAGGGGGAG